MAIRGVFFDLGGTLLVMRRDRIISRILSDAGYQSTPKDVHSAYFKVETGWLAIYGDKKMNGVETEEAYRELDAMIFRCLFPRSKDDEAKRVSRLTRRMWSEVEKDVPSELYPDVIPVLTRLTSDGYRLGLVSNAPPDTLKVIESLGLPLYLPTVVVSGVVGVSKPNPEIFRIALRTARVEAREAIHVGDLYEADVIGARNAGIQGILLDRDGNRPDLDCPTISGLEGVYEFLE
jgi:HAD superfamily hydrolase (TIGR01549 family)